VNRAGGSIEQLMLQGKAAVVTILYSAILTALILKLIDWTIGLRTSEDGEKIGLDLTDHAETAYTVS
jgi:Amt family ammonium transporter